MINKVLVNTCNINSKTLTNNNKINKRTRTTTIKRIKRMSQLQQYQQAIIKVMI